MSEWLGVGLGTGGLEEGEGTGGGGDRREKDFPPPFTTSNNLTSNHDNKQRHYKYSVEGGRVGVSWEGGGSGRGRVVSL